MTDARLAGWRALIAEHQGNREAVIQAAGVTRDVLDGAFRRALSSFARECDAARAGASAPVGFLIIEVCGQLHNVTHVPAVNGAALYFRRLIGAA